MRQAFRSCLGKNIKAFKEQRSLDTRAGFYDARLHGWNFLWKVCAQGVFTEVQCNSTLIPPNLSKSVSDTEA